MTHELAVANPPAPGSVVALVASFLPSIKYDSTVCNTHVAQDNISLGRCDMAKFAGICEGRRRWNRLVRISSGGLSNASGWFFPPRSEPAKDSQLATRQVQLPLEVLGGEAAFVMHQYRRHLPGNH